MNASATAQAFLARPTIDQLRSAVVDVYCAGCLRNWWQGFLAELPADRPMAHLAQQLGAARCTAIVPPPDRRLVCGDRLVVRITSEPLQSSMVTIGPFCLGCLAGRCNPRMACVDRELARQLRGR